MRLDWVRSGVLVALAVGTGLTSWSGSALLLPVALAFPVLWAQSRSRLAAALVSAGYFLAASRGLPQGVAAFYASGVVPGLLLWLVASLGFVGVHTLLWSPRPRRSSIRFLTASILMAAPPFGIMGWAHPITAAGVLFPGWGWWGLLGLTAGLIGLVTRIWPAVGLTLAGAWLWSAANWTNPIVPEGWTGVDLELGASLGRDLSLRRHRDLIASARAAAGVDTPFVVFPESALGNWTPTIEHVWVKALEGSNLTVIAGATVIHQHGYDNVLIAVSSKGARVLYLERMPVPGAMWQPGRRWLGMSGGATANFLANPAVELGGQRLAPLICYEQLLVWPALQSMSHDPDLIVAVGNGWWSSGSSIVAIQRASMIAWARLFSKPLVMSFNI